VTDDEPLVRDIERAIGGQIERRRLDGFDYGPFNPEFRPTVAGTGAFGRPANGRSARSVYRSRNNHSRW
jgi:hypothetical protein